MLLPTTCPVCRQPGPAPCPACVTDLLPPPALPPPVGVDICRAVLAYDGPGREIVARLKYRNARSTLSWLADGMARLAPSTLDGPATVTWVPTSSARRHERGFDQAELLARAVARRLDLPCRSLLRRGRGPAQTGRSVAERRRGPQFAAARPPPSSVLLVDDVVTSGSTVTAAARALRSAGARRVVVLAAARTPLRAWA